MWLIPIGIIIITIIVLVNQGVLWVEYGLNDDQGSIPASLRWYKPGSGLTIILEILSFHVAVWVGKG